MDSSLDHLCLSVSTRPTQAFRKMLCFLQSQALVASDHCLLLPNLRVSDGSDSNAAHKTYRRPEEKGLDHEAAERVSTELCCY